MTMHLILRLRNFIERTGEKVSDPVLIALSALCMILASAFGLYFVFASPPGDFTPEILFIDPGQSATGISNEFENARVVKSSILLRSAIILLGGERKITAGAYEFKTPQSAFTVAYRIIKGQVGYAPVRLTVPEGTTDAEIVQMVHSTFPEMSTSTFSLLIRGKEGYLFPDTYFFSPFARPQDVAYALEHMFTVKIAPYRQQIVSSGRSLADIVTMASVLEAEVRTESDRKMVADILWRRIGLGIPLQVDSSLTYILGKNSADLTLADLKTDSPYNTYIHKGLPPGPISNPGMVSIEAALDPTPDTYLYFISDKNGMTHFSSTLQEHDALKQKYL